MKRQWSYWERDSLLQSIDILIIGSGFSGLFSAYYAKKKYPNAQVTLMDRAATPYGASTRNAGFACFGSISEILSDMESMGLEKALKLVEERFLGLELLQSLVPEGAMDFVREGGHELFTDFGEYNKCKSHISYLNNYLHKLKEGVFFNSNPKDFGIGGRNELYSISTPFEAQLHPMKLLRYMQNLVNQMGVEFIGGVEVLNISNEAHGVRVHFDDIDILVPKVLVCTNALAPHLLPHVDLVAQRGQVILSQRFNKPLFQGNIHAVEGYFYARCTSDHRVLIGGARHLDFKTEKSSDFQTNDLLISALKDFAESYLLGGESFDIQYQWSGIMGFADSGQKDYILGSDGNVHYAVRLSGMGVALAPFLSKQLVNYL